MRQSGIDLSSECTLAERSCIMDAIKNIKEGEISWKLAPLQEAL